MLRALPLLAAALFVLPACSSSAPTSASGEPGEPLLIEDVVTYSGGMMGGSGPFTLLSLRDGRVVVAPEADARADSASAAWDIGLRGTEVIVNGGASGPGGVRGVLAEMSYEEVTGVPDGLATDGEGECPGGRDPRVVCHGSGNGWYAYGDAGVSPIPTRTLVIRRPDGSAAKVRFVSYVLGEEGMGARPRFVTLEVTPLPAE